ncbi:MAG: DUF58 domain-containing protein [Acidobacteriota bacterium]|nr:DUF58 domain-containing protein [Acidobacteriota bacterium]
MLPQEILRKVRKIEIVTNRLVNEGLAGEYHSVFKGRGMEFAEVREYQAGDDVRTIDWNVTSRMGHPYVKQYVEERELTVMLAVDASGSGEFGSARQLKRELAAEVAALLAFSAIQNNDRVGLLIFSDKVEKYLSPRRGRRHVLRVIREILYFQPTHRGTRLAAALDTLNRVLHKRSVVFVLSDFLDQGYERSLMQTSRRHDVIVIPVIDRREGELPSVGLVALRDAETGEERVFDTRNKAVRREYMRRGERRREALESMLKRASIDSVFLSTDEPYDRALVEFFHLRARRRRR